MAFISGPLSNSLFAATLNARNNFQMVYSAAQGYNKLATITSALNIKTGGTRIDTHNGLYEYAWDDRNVVISQIKTSTQIGNNLVLTFYDSSYEYFRGKDYVMDSDQNKGHVYSSAPGSVTLQPAGTAFTSTMFVANMYCKTIADLSGVRDSTGKTTLQSIPNLDYNYCSVMRDSCRLSRKDRIATYTLNGSEYQYSKTEQDMVARVANYEEYMLIFGDRAQFTANQEGITNASGGLDWSIKNRGGIYKPLTSSLTIDVFHDTLLQHKVRSTSDAPITLAMGSAAWMYINQNFTADYIKYAGNTNTFGGTAVKGLSVEQYAIAGRVYNIVLLPILDDEKMFPELSNIPGVRGTRMSNRIYGLDLSPLPVVGNEGHKLPCIERLHWGEDGAMYRVISGMSGPQGNSTGGPMVGQYQFTSSAVDGYQIEYLRDIGFNIPVANRFFMIEYAS